MNVLNGAKLSIGKFRPFMLIEHLKSDQERMVSWLKESNYTIYSGIGANFLCIPKEAGVGISDLTLVT